MMKKIVIVVLLMTLLLVGCDNKNVSPFGNKEKLHNLYFDELEEFSEVSKKSGTLDSGMDWESYSYQIDSIIITITYYKDRNLENSTNYLTNAEEIKLHNITYKYNEMEVVDYMKADYYTQVGKDTYCISAIYKDTEKNRETLKTFLDTVRVKE